MIIYEYPFNELVRSLLRLEYLFDRFEYFVEKDDARDQHQAISILFDLGEITARADLKSSLMKELDRQKNSLLSLKNSSNIDQDALLNTLEEMNIIWGKINQTGKTNAQILESEWLNLIRSRLSIPGGTSPVDLPAYYAWQFTDANIRRANLKKFVEPLMSWKYASQLFLKLLRGSGKPAEMLAPKGSYQQMLSGKTYQLMRVGIQHAHLIPEISANKYMLWTRFMTCDGEAKPRAFAEDVPFELSLCNF